jgi:hypothetical protein
MRKPEFVFQDVTMLDDRRVFDKHYDEMHQLGEMDVLRRNYPKFELGGCAWKVFKRV